MLFAWLAAMPAALTSAATGGSASPTSSAVETAPEYLRAAVTLDGKVLFYVRGISSYPAARRARESVRRYGKLPPIRPSLPIRSAQLKARSSTTIVTGDRTVLTVFDSDAELEGTSRTIMAGVVRVKIAEAMTAYRIDRSPRVLLINTGYALGATLVLVLLLLPSVASSAGWIPLPSGALSRALRDWKRSRFSCCRPGNC